MKRIIPLLCLCLLCMGCPPPPPPPPAEDDDRSLSPPPPVLPYTPILVNGSSGDKFDVVFVGDGFRADEQDLFRAKALEAVNAIATHPLYGRYMCALNIWGVEVVSDESGADHPIEGIMVNTALNCTYGDGSALYPPQLIWTRTPELAQAYADRAPGCDCIYILVNDAEYGGASAGSSNYVTTYTGIELGGVATHELGHFIGSLADEYEQGRGSYTGGEPSQVNATTKTSLDEIKWKALIPAGTALPTVEDPPPSVELIGLFEGAMRYESGIYRPSITCHMKELPAAFCGVCAPHMRSRLQRFCTLCEWLPEHPGCDVSEFRTLLTVRSLDRRKRIPLPPQCLSCPPFRIGPDSIRIILDGPAVADVRYDVVDAQGTVLASSKASQGNITLSFTQDPSAKSFLAIGPVEGGQVHGILEKELTWSASLKVNGKDVASIGP